MDDLWPKDLALSKVRTPLAILKEQASLLGQRTGGLVTAEIRRYERPPAIRLEDTDFGYGFDVVAPALGGYRYRLFSIYHGIALYPVTIELDDEAMLEIDPESKGRAVAALDEAAFVRVLERIFKAKKARRVIEALWAQSGA